MFEIVTDIRINAAPATVWGAIVDIGAWGGWHPYISSLAGEMRVGGTLRMTADVEGKLYHQQLTVTALEPMRKFCWSGELHEPLYAKGTHCLIVEAEGEGTLLKHVEVVKGPLAESAAVPAMKEMAYRGFELANAALKSHAERLASVE